MRRNPFCVFSKKEAYVLCYCLLVWTSWSTAWASHHILVLELLNITGLNGLELPVITMVTEIWYKVCLVMLQLFKSILWSWDCISMDMSGWLWNHEPLDSEDKDQQKIRPVVANAMWTGARFAGHFAMVDWECETWNLWAPHFGFGGFGWAAPTPSKPWAGLDMQFSGADPSGLIDGSKTDWPWKLHCNLSSSASALAKPWPLCRGRRTMGGRKL
jgi:hypothetical protein